MNYFALYSQNYDKICAIAPTAPSVYVLGTLDDEQLREIAQAADQLELYALAEWIRLHGENVKW